MFKRSMIGGGLLAALLAAPAAGQVFPTGAHTAYNFIPFGVNQVVTNHQVYLASLFGSSPVQIDELGFATADFRQGQQIEIDVVIRMGYTDRAPGGLSTNLPDNIVGTLTEVYRVTNRLHTNASTGPNVFDLIFELDTPFVYDPTQNNLLIEYDVNSRVVNGDASISTNGDGNESSRAWNSTRFGDGADLVGARTQFEMSTPGPRFEISLTGSCPGPMTLRWTGASAGRPAGVAIASGTGNFIIPGGPCVGTQLGLNSTASLLTPPGQFSTGPNGEGSFSGNAGGGACGRFLQMVVFQSGAPPCETSNVVQIN